MKQITKISILAAFFVISFLGFSQDRKDGFDSEKQGIELTINGEKFVVENLPQDGTIEVFNILGTKVMTFNVNSGTNSNRVNLPKGYYILKSDNVTKKIAVK